MREGEIFISVFEYLFCQRKSIYYSFCLLVLISLCQFKCMEATLVGSLRREKMAETALRKLEAEIDHVKQFVSA